MKKKKNYSIDVGVLTVSEIIEMLQSLSSKHQDWPVYCCGSSDCYLCINEDEEYVVIDEEDLYEEIEELDEAEGKTVPWY